SFFPLLRTPRPTLFPYTTLFRSPKELDVPYNTVPLPATSTSDGIVGSATSPSCDPPAYACYAGALLRVWDPNVQPAISDQWNLTDRKSTRLNSSHQIISYAVFCL